MSILEQVLELGLAGKKEKASNMMQTEMQKLATELGRIASRYPKADLPLVTATMHLAAKGFEGIAGPEGRELAANIVKMVGVTAMEFDVAEARKQMEEGK